MTTSLKPIAPALPPEPARSGILDFVAAPAIQTLSDEAFQTIENQVIAVVNAELGQRLTSANIDQPDPALKQQVETAARRALMRVLSEKRIPYSGTVEDRFVQSILNKLLGYGWLEVLLPPQRDVIEIMVNQEGSLWVIPRGSSQPQRVLDVQPSPADVMLVIGKILGGANRRVTEAEPRMDARLPRTRRLPHGARIHVVIPQIAVGEYPILNIRLYEQEPIRPATLLSWGALSQEVFAFLTNAVKQKCRVMISGGTGTGKTTLLSALGNFIPAEARIVTIEDTVEIFIDRPHVVTLEARPPSMEGKYGVSMSDLVVDAMRMTPQWLIVGEIRTGSAASALFSAQMSDHPGLSTIHALSPEAALERLSLLMQIDPTTTRIQPAAIKKLVTQALDLIVQLEYINGVRRVTRVTQVADTLQHGDVFLNDLWRFDPATTTWHQLADLTKTR
ncbi:MAG: CpaF family protein [Chloroflexi bacterium]|nr:CpaF family protein [Chloroflexota bacterium]